MVAISEAASVSILIMLLFVAVFNLATSQRSLEYQTGYDAGYTEHNNTKYSAAQELVGSLSSLCTEAQLNYAAGYIAGYECFEKTSAHEEFLKINTAKLNNSIEVLGL